jgi:hypothetical protein
MSGYAFFGQEIDTYHKIYSNHPTLGCQYINFAKVREWTGSGLGGGQGRGRGGREGTLTHPLSISPSLYPYPHIVGRTHIL